MLADEKRAVPFAELLEGGARNGLYKQKEFHGRGAKIVNMGELFAHPRLRSVPMKRVAVTDDELKRFSVGPGDLLFARRSLVAEGAGKCSVVLEVDEPTVFESSIIRVRPNQARVDSLFLYYLFRSPHGVHLLDTIRRDAVVAGITGTDLLRLPIGAPSLARQRSIAEILGALDDKIELNRRTNATLESVARALFKSWFVDFDPVRAKAEGRTPTGMDPETAALFPDELADSELGPIPRGWTSMPLAGVVDALSGGTPTKGDARYWGGDIPWISPKVMTSLHADEADAFVTEAAIGNGTRIAPALSTLVMVRGMGLHQEVRVSQARRDVTFNQDVKALVPRGIDPTLLLFAMLDAQPSLLARVETSGHGTGKLPTEILLAHGITLPPRAVQDQLAPTFEALNDRIAVGRAESRILARLRDELLPRLLSGELSPSVSEDRGTRENHAHQPSS
jgi:type I restriction enzyme S subunit